MILCIANELWQDLRTGLFDTNNSLLAFLCKKELQNLMLEEILTHVLGQRNTVVHYFLLDPQTA